MSLTSSRPPCPACGGARFGQRFNRGGLAWACSSCGFRSRHRPEPVDEWAEDTVSAARAAGLL